VRTRIIQLSQAYVIDSFNASSERRIF